MIQFVVQPQRYTSFTLANYQLTNNNKNKESLLSHQKQFAEWMSDHEKMLKHIIVGFEAKPAIQEELFQEIALNIWQALPKFKGDASVKTFVARIAHNILVTHVAKAVRTVKADQDINEQEHIASGEATPYQQLDKQQRQQRLFKAIRQLKLDQQQIITLALEGMSYQEMADILSISINLVGVRLQRAKTSLMQLLEAK
ncbi:RNA polymerase sigma factor [Thalassotalea sp. M1531]|uniref:RNA polymerase sigma factor n=1 Tax=Thalassotalea algicola TaxID=2716224 RepID=A0A7Y0LBZ5_9GAMM|nr:RNA polymerase sigma factor [Thalassotalea algicola]NMP30886.1 RNA polymerase sigma factor [Thalassotalea algicola]